MKESTTYQTVLREGRIESKQEDLLDILRDRFGPLPTELEQRINATTDLPTLRAAVRAAATVASLDEFTL